MTMMIMREYFSRSLDYLQVKCATNTKYKYNNTRRQIPKIENYKNTTGGRTKFFSGLLIDQPSVQRAGKAKLGQLHLQNQYLHQLLTLVSIFKLGGMRHRWLRWVLETFTTADCSVQPMIWQWYCRYAIWSTISTETFIFPDEIQSHIICRNCVIQQKMANQNPLCDTAHRILF